MGPSHLVPPHRFMRAESPHTALILGEYTQCVPMDVRDIREYEEKKRQSHIFLILEGKTKRILKKIGFLPPKEILIKNIFLYEVTALTALLFCCLLPLIFAETELAHKFKLK